MEPAEINANQNKVVTDNLTARSIPSNTGVGVNNQKLDLSNSSNNLTLDNQGTYNYEENFQVRFKRNFQRFEEAIKNVANEFSKIPVSETIRLISHLDADGISSAAIIIKALNRRGMFYTLTILPQLKEEDVRQLAKEDYNYYVFTDLGSGELNVINEVMKGKHVFILDHHQPQQCNCDKNIFHINPHLFGFNGSSEICGAGVTFFFAKALDIKNEDLAYTALIGVIGDIQNPEAGLNSLILDTARRLNQIKVITGLRIFGAQTKPLYKALFQGSDFYIPGVTGSESGAIQFLKQIGVEPKFGNKWRRIIDLDDEELKKLVAGIVMLRFGEEKPEDILGNVYLVKDEKEGSPLKDLKEFATVLNACGRMGRASYGIGACLGDKKLKRLAVSVLSDYRKEIVKGLKWFESHRSSASVIEEPGFVIINARDKVLATVIGTVSSIISKSPLVDKSTFVLGLARINNKYTKISLRYKGEHKNINLKEIITEIVDGLGGEAGGHHNAAGAYIPIESEALFMNKAKLVLRNLSIEEKI